MIFQEDVLALYSAIGAEQIDDTRGYWLVRTEGGRFYDDFNIGLFIGLGFNKITEKTLTDCYNNEMANEQLKELIIERYPEETRPGLITSYITTFYKTMKRGDIVAIPSEGSHSILFGEIMDDVYFEDEKNITNLEDSGVERTICPYYMRRKVKWIKSVARDKLDLKFLKALFAHNAIVDLREYGAIIDRMLSSIFVKDRRLHYKLVISTEAEIPLEVYVDLVRSLQGLCDEFNNLDETFNMSCDMKDISVKMQAESPGFWEFISESAGTVAGYLPELNFLPTIVVIGIAGVVIMGGDFKLGPLELKTPGLSAKILEWANFVKDKSDSAKLYKAVMAKLEKEDVKEENELAEVIVPMLLGEGSLTEDSNSEDTENSKEE